MRSDEVADVLDSAPQVEDPWPAEREADPRMVAGLLGQLSWADFARESLGIEARSGRGRATAHAALFSLEEARDAIARAHGSGRGYHLRVDTESRGDRPSSDKREVSPEQLPALVAGGATICVNRIHRGSRKLQATLRRVLELTGWRGSVGMNCYLSTSQMGFGTHYDFRHVTSLQIAGQKTWTHGLRPALAGPRRGAYFEAGPRHAERRLRDARWEIFDDAEAARPEREQTVLRAGHFLALPAGTWHSARAGGYSLALNLYFQNHYFSESVYRMLGPRMDAFESWRLGWPPTPEGLGEDLSLPPRARDYAAARLEELRALVNELDVDDPAVLSALLALGRID